MMLLGWLASRWVAGDDVASVVRICARLQGKGIRPLVNYLGEHHRTKLLVERAVEMYLEVLESLHLERLKADLSLKLTGIGLEVGKGYCLKHLLLLLHRAREVGSRVWIDMEARPHVEDTLELYREAARQYPNLAVTLQVNLRRARRDLLDVLDRGGRVRLVKGAYPGDYRGWEEKEERFSRLLRLLFARGDGFAVATSSAPLIEQAMILQERYHRAMEFQFLLGSPKRLIAQVPRSETVAVYVPFGTASLPYVWRRLREHGLSAALSV